VSSLPPYNPPPAERRVWLLNSATPAAARERLLGAVQGTERVESDDLEHLREKIRSAADDLLVAAPEEALEALVLGLIGGRQGMARMRFPPGTLSEVQMLSDRAVVRHLNPGIDF
jgi:2-keto-3-deoxy-galactonokinase